MALQYREEVRYRTIPLHGTWWHACATKRQPWPASDSAQDLVELSWYYKHYTPRLERLSWIMLKYGRILVLVQDRSSPIECRQAF